MMKWCSVFWIAMLAVNDGDGLTTPSGISKFWTDDYKVFDHIYGKTSDKDIYGDQLPASFTYGIDVAKFKKTDALTVKNKRIKDNDDDAAASSSQVDPYGFGDNFSQMLHHRLKNTKAPAKPTTKMTDNKLIYNLYKPISEETDPETFDYFKHLEQLGKQETIDFPLKSISGFKPYTNLSPANTEDNSYRSIQDILLSQDHARVKPKYVADDVQYLNYPVSELSRGKKPNIRLNQSNNLNFKGSKCGGKSQGRCRKRSNNNNYVRARRPRPVIRAIKHTIVSD